MNALEIWIDLLSPSPSQMGELAPSERSAQQQHLRMSLHVGLVPHDDLD